MAKAPKLENLHQLTLGELGVMAMTTFVIWFAWILWVGIPTFLVSELFSLDVEQTLSFWLPRALAVVAVIHYWLRHGPENHPQLY